MPELRGEIADCEGVEKKKTARLLKCVPLLS